MFDSALTAMSRLNPISLIDFWSKNFNFFDKQVRITIKNLPIQKSQKKFWETFINFSAANWYFQENALRNNETLINFRKKIVINVFREIQKANPNFEKISKLMEIGAKKEIEIFKKDDKKISQIIGDLRAEFINALFSEDENHWLDFSRSYMNKQYWAGNGIKKLMEIVKDEYGLDIESDEVLRTPALRLLKIRPVYNEGERAEDFKYTPQPVVWFPPTVLDHHIVSLLPRHGMSLVHHLAKFHPTYVMILNDYSSEEVLKMSPEDFVEQTAILLNFVQEQEKIKPIFGGYCQGGTIAVLTSLTEKLRPLVKSVFTIVAATGKKDEDTTTSVFLDNLELVSEVVKNGYMVAPEFLSIPLKKDNWSPYGDVLNNLSKAERYVQRIKEMIETKGYDIKKARKVLAYEIIKEVVLEIWLASMHHIPISTTAMTLPVFRDGIMPDGTYNLELFGQRLQTRDFDKYNIPVHIFAGEFDKVVPVVSATELKKQVKNCFVHLFSDGHIAPATNFKGGVLQQPIIETVESIFKNY